MLELVWERAGGDTPHLSVLMPVFRSPAFVGEAVQSVLAQRDCVLDVLISDDASGDDTLATALAAAKAYTGPHSIRVFRTPTNLAMGHLGALVAAARADFMVEAHGDDISPPDRMARMLAIHRQSGAALVTSLVTRLEDGRATVQQMPRGLTEGLQPDRVVLERRPSIFQGARYGFHRRIYDDFPPLTVTYLPRGHDVLQAFRAQLVGGVYLSAEPLLTRRIHEGQWGRRLWDTRTPPANMFGFNLSRLGILAVMRTDLEHFEASHADPQRAKSLRGLIDAEERKALSDMLEARKTLRLQGYEPQWQTFEEIARANAAGLPLLSEPTPPASPMARARSWLRRILSRTP